MSQTNNSGLVKSGQPTKAWQTLSQLLPHHNPDHDWWWQFAGQHLASLVEAAGYSIERQFEALLFFYHWGVPFMGQAPRSDGSPVTWKSTVTLDGTPLELSWKWNTRSEPPNIRYAIDPIGKQSGSRMDPLNQQASRELLGHVADTLPTVDLSWAHYFLDVLFDHNHSKYTQEGDARARSTVLFSAEFLSKGLTTKTYFFPRKLGETSFMSHQGWETSISGLDPNNEARSLLNDFITSSAEGQLLKPFSVAIDNLAPEKSRLKWYFNTPHTSFASVRDVMTLGGRIDTPYMVQALADLYDLVKAVFGLPADFPEDADLSASPNWDSSRNDASDQISSGFLYYFDVAPGMKLPEIKIFVPTRYYAVDDISAARGITGWMEAHGRGAYCKRYMDVLQKLAGHRQLDGGRGVQTYVACLFKKDGTLDITTYMDVQAFRSSELSKGRRGTLRRDDY